MRIAAACLAAAGLGTSAAAQEPEPPGDDPTVAVLPPEEPPGEPVERFELFPEDHLYAPYLADPHRPGFGVMVLGVTDPEVAESGDLRAALKLGGRFAIFRLRSRERPERALQLSIEAGFYGQFDVDHQLDNLGWDGIYGLLATAAVRTGLQLKTGTVHTSSHVGDEYAERTGRLRLGYTREEWVLGASWRPDERWRFYADGGWAFDVRSELQERGRLQTGAEHQVPAAWGGRWGWYAALDLQAFEERDWQPDVTAQVGLSAPAGERRWRVGVGWRDGRVPIGEFFQDDESYFVLGLWLDL